MNDLLHRVLEVLSGGAADPQVRRLAQLLAIPPTEALAIPADPGLSYRPFTIRKRDGGRRQIVAPSGRLKLLQRRLLRRYLANFPVHEAAMAFIAGHSIATHARRHLRQAIVLTVDLEDFFPSTATRRVRAWFRQQDWRDESLDILMRLCVYRGGLPQGAPTSPALSNLVNLPLDAELSELAARSGGRYSRYCDDLAFSWGTELEPPMFRAQVEECLRRFGYSVQTRKGWRLQYAQERPELTGLVLDRRRLRLSQRILERWRKVKSSGSVHDPATRARLAGYLGIQKMIR
jgi:hypothetical protein